MGRRMLPKPPEGGHHHQQRSHSLDRSAELHLSSQDDIADDDDMAAAAAAANALLNASFSGPASLPISTTSSSQSPRGGGEVIVQVALRRLQEGNRLRPIPRLRAGLHHVQLGRQGGMTTMLDYH